MTTKEVQQAIDEAGGDWGDFLTFMVGQTYGIDENGEPDYYERDVQAFIRGITPDGNTK